MLNMLLLINCTWADRIVFNNGKNVEVTILDTSGCTVSISRKGKKSNIKKSLIASIVVENETVDYHNYRCKAKEKIKYRKFSDSPEYEIMTFIDNCDEIEQVFKEGKRTLFLLEPLQGLYNADEFLEVQQTLHTILKEKTELLVVSSKKLLQEIKDTNSSYTYAFVARKFHTEIGNTRRPRSSNVFLSEPGSTEKKKILILTAEFALIDLQRKEVVFHPETYSKRFIYGAKENNFLSLGEHTVLMDLWLKRFKKDADSYNRERNVRSVTKEMAKLLTEYLSSK